MKQHHNCEQQFKTKHILFKSMSLENILHILIWAKEFAHIISDCKSRLLLSSNIWRLKAQESNFDVQSVHFHQMNHIICFENTVHAQLLPYFIFGLFKRYNLMQ